MAVQIEQQYQNEACGLLQAYVTARNNNLDDGTVEDILCTVDSMDLAATEYLMRLAAAKLAEHSPSYTLK